MKKSIWICVCISLAFCVKAQFPVSPTFYGQNFWETNNNPNNSSTAGADLPIWTEMSASGARIIRIGGEGYNKAPSESRTYPMQLTTMAFYPQGYVTMCDNIRKRGCEPMVEVPCDGNTSNISLYAAHAAEIVRVLNVVHKRNITYFVISNEPELDFSSSYTAADIEAYIEPIAFAMKSVDPNIKVVGPELKQNFTGYTLASDLISGPNQITDPIPSGIAAGKKYVDFFSWHRYDGYTPNTILSRTDYIERGYNQLNSWSPNTLPSGMGLIIDEYNLKSVGTDQFNSTAWNDVTCNPNSFLGGQYIVDMMAGMIKANVSISNMWSAKEGTDQGFVSKSGTNYYEKPTYWHYWMMANYMRDNFYIPTIANDASGNPITATNNAFRGIKAYGALTGHYAAVLVMNENTASATFGIGFGTSATSGFNANFAMGMPVSFSNFNQTITGESTFLYLFDCSSGTLTGHFELKKSDLSTSYDLPTQHYVAGSLTSPQQPLKVTLTNPNACLGSNSRDASVNLTGTSVTWERMPYGEILPNGLALQPGFYKVTVTTSCGSSTAVFSVHENSPVVDAGPDQFICSVATTNFNLGNQINNLPTISPGYSWSESNTSCTLPSGATTANSSNDFITNASCNASSQYVQTANDGSGCQGTDDAYVYITNGAADLYIKDWTDDIGNEVNNETNMSVGPIFWQSPDIWIRQVNDGYTNQTSQPIEYAPSSNNYVYVRVINKGCSAQSGTLRVYWAKASTGLSWPTMWNSFSTTYVGCAATLYGDQITSSSGISINIPAGSEQVFEIPWQPQNPNDYSCFGADQHHFCLLARIETASSYPYGMTYPEGNDVWMNTFQNNNIAWRNIYVDNAYPPFIVHPPVGSVIIRNVVEKPRFIKLNFVSVKDDAGQALTDYTKVRLNFTQGFLKRWYEGGKRGKDVVLINDSTVELTSANATMEHIFLPYLQVGGVSVSLQSFKNPILSKDQQSKFNIIQYSEDVGISTPQGGQTYLFKKQFYGPKCQTASNTLSGPIVGTKTVSGTVEVTGNVTVLAGSTLILQNALVLVDANIKVQVVPGGIIKVLNSEIRSACVDKKWKGIDIKGNVLLPNPLVFDKSTISGTDYPLSVDMAKGIQITNSAFINDGLGTAITLTKMKDFTITGNTIDGYDIGIDTKNTDLADVRSLISKNVFDHVRVAVNFSNDNHKKLDILCNKFRYTDYAILSTQTQLSDQGTLTSGAGNEFSTSSTLTDNKLKHVNGNTLKYYYDPTNPISSGMNVTVVASLADPVCYTYSFDTSTVSSARLMSMAGSGVSSQVSLLLSPNPNPGLTTLQYSIGANTSGEIVISDLYGKIIARVPINSRDGKVDLNCLGYADGIYLVTLITESGQTMNQKMVIAK